MPGFTTELERREARLALYEAALRERLPKNVFKAMEDAASVLASKPAHLAIMARGIGQMGCIPSPSADAVAHALMEDPGCTVRPIDPESCHVCEAVEEGL